MRDDERHRGQTQSARLWLLVAITVILVGWALHATAAVMIPLVFSIFLALIVAPLDHGVASKVPGKLGWLGHVAAMGAILVVMLLFVGMIWLAAQQVVQRFPDPSPNSSLLEQVDKAMSDGSEQSDTAASGEKAQASAAGETGTATAEDGGKPGDPFGRFDRIFDGAQGALLGRLADWASGTASQILAAAGATLFSAVLVFFLTLIMLVEGPDWRRKISTVLDNQAREKSMDSVGIIADRLRRYLVARTVLGGITALLYAVWLWVFGIDLLFVWPLIAFVLSFVPTLGSMISGALPVIYAFIQKDFGSALAVGAGIFVIEQVMGNYIDPRVQARQVSLSSLVVLVTLLVWGWIWGIAGTILAVPVTIAAMIICAHVDALRPVALMLSDAKDYEGLDHQANSLNT